MKVNAEKLKSNARPLTDEERAIMNYRIENADWLHLSATIALRIRKALRQQNLSQADLSVRLGVTPAQVSKLLSGKVNFELKTISKIQSVLGVPIINVGQNTSSEAALEDRHANNSVVVVYVSGGTVSTTTSANKEFCFREFSNIG